MKERRGGDAPNVGGAAWSFAISRSLGKGRFAAADGVRAIPPQYVYNASEYILMPDSRFPNPDSSSHYHH